MAIPFALRNVHGQLEYSFYVKECPRSTEEHKSGIRLACAFLLYSMMLYPNISKTYVQM
jgi:hypothetical protein